jgi:Uncharacterized protein conserved in bacteria (DUF2188)
MSKGENRHVVQRPDGQWAEEFEGASRASGLYPTQAEAEAAARAHLQQTPGGGELLVHGRDGKIRDRSTINRPDPFPPRG